MHSVSAPAPAEHPHIPYHLPRPESPAAQQQAGADFLARMQSRRSCRFFADTPVPRPLIELAIRAAGSAPSGAHKQPWTFVAVSDPHVKRNIQLAAEAEEYESYEGGRMPPSWREDLAPLGTDWQKPFLTIAPWLIVVFAQSYGLDAEGNQHKHYYVNESVGIASGLLLAALHHMGLATLTHTPSPMNFLQGILNRPKNERPYLLVPVGYPAPDATVPDLQRKPLHDISVWV